MQTTKQIIEKSGIAFGTSGARGLVVDFTAEVCAAFAIAFVESIKPHFQFDTIALAIDNRPSSYSMAQAIAAALAGIDIQSEYHGVLPTPALAYYAMQQKLPCIMVTGSHIPFDRNGLKFYRPDGEITKDDEKAILNVDVALPVIGNLSELALLSGAQEAYIERNTNLFDSNILLGKRIGIYEHSSAGRGIYRQIFEALGAEVTSLGRSDEFVPIDTEAVSKEDKERARRWVAEHQLDALFSTDGDGDRPLLSDEKGEWLRGDILGLLCAKLLGVEALAIPVNCNTMIKKVEQFKVVSLTKIGSPYVIAECTRLLGSFTKVAGFEANGGFILFSDIEFGSKTVKRLPTRDALLPILIVLGCTVSIYSAVGILPSVFTESDRMQNVNREICTKILDSILNNPSCFFEALPNLGLFLELDITDGLRFIFENSIVHVRLSGNAPEMRCYVESYSLVNSRKLIKHVFNYFISKGCLS
ncbi:phosphomannomutase [Pseudoalteromonas xiamenensis]|uniref:phosphomannomutase n=1 Tax=Pseudoalteromonas xiamenensis TaxID=882626 RepID=UPI0035EC8F27